MDDFRLKKMTNTSASFYARSRRPKTASASRPKISDTTTIQCENLNKITGPINIFFSNPPSGFNPRAFSDDNYFVDSMKHIFTEVVPPQEKPTKKQRQIRRLIHKANKLNEIVIFCILELTF